MLKLLFENSIMEDLLRKSSILVQQQTTAFVRSMAGRIDWSDRLIGILGARGTGKTTLLLQQLKLRYGQTGGGLYVTLDDLYFTGNRLLNLAEQFVQVGGKALFIDEVHKYPDWAREIKLMYDTHRDLTIVFTGSSVTEMIHQDADLSRRAVRYDMPGLSFREYLAFERAADLPVLTLEDILQRHTGLAADMSATIKPLMLWKDYVHTGYYPFYLENKSTYHIRLEQVVKMVIESDLRYIEGFDPVKSRKVYELLYILATNVPFKPNITSLSAKTGIHRNTLTLYLRHLEKARLINLLYAAGNSVSILQKPEKIFLENTNLQYALAPVGVNRGTLRETFFLNQLVNAGHRMTVPAAGDFLVDDEYVFEIGGKDKTTRQVKDTRNAYVAADDLETGALNRIPLWIFGFLY